MNFKTLLLVLAVFTIISCGDDSSPVLTINSPENGSTFFVGDSFEIRGTMTDDVGIATLGIESELFAVSSPEEIAGNPTSQSFTFPITLVTGTPVGEFDIKITLTDTDGNSDDETLTINIE